MAASVGRFWDAGDGQIFPALKMLKRDGRVETAAERTGKSPERVVYRITESGRVCLLEWLNTSGERERLRLAVLLKLLFGSPLGAAENAGRVARFGKRRRRSLEEIRRFKRAPAPLASDGDPLYDYLTVLFGGKNYRACVEWADEATALIDDAPRMRGEDSHGPEAVDP